MEVFIVILKIVFRVSSKTVDIGYKIFRTSITWIGEVVFILSVLLLTFIIVVHVFWTFNLNGLYLDLDANNHKSEIDMSFNFSTVTIEGTYVETNTGYLMIPNSPFSLPVVPKLTITKKDDKHISIIGLNFVKKQPMSVKGHLNISNPNGIDCFVPDHG